MVLLSFAFFLKNRSSPQKARRTAIVESSGLFLFDLSLNELNQLHDGNDQDRKTTDLIHLNGEIERLVDNNEDANVDPWEITNGAKGYNSISRHVVYVGGVVADGKTTKDTRTKAQRAAMESYVKEFHRKHPNVRIIGHREVDAKDCPSFDVQVWLKEIGVIQ